MSQTNGKQKHAGGRPRIVRDVHELQQKVTEYFNAIESQPILQREPVTITGLVLYCGYCDLQSFYDMEKRKEFSSTVKRARMRVSNAYERRLSSSTPAGAIFALKNFGWHDDYQGRLVQQGPAPKFIFYLNGAPKEVSASEIANGSLRGVPSVLDGLGTPNGGAAC